MLIQELFDTTPKDVIVVYPGRFQPFHRGHYAVYEHLTQKYGTDNVFICTSNKVEEGRSPFNFEEKLLMMEHVGINSNNVVQSSQPYKALEITEHYDPDNTILLFAVSEKDMSSTPRFSFNAKKDGSASYFQRLPENINQANTFNKHAYIITVPTFEFNIMGNPVYSASQIRNEFSKASNNQRKNIVTDLYETYSDSIFSLLSSKL